MKSYVGWMMIWLSLFLSDEHNDRRRIKPHFNAGSAQPYLK